MDVSKMYRIFEINNPVGVNTGVEITSGRYRGLKYHYTTVSFGDKGEKTKVNFDYELIADPRGVHNPQKRKLVKLMGRILVDMIKRYGAESLDDGGDDEVEYEEEYGPRNADS